MVHLSEILNVPVLDAAGVRLGRLHDVLVDSMRSRVEALVFRAKGRSVRVPWAGVETFSPLGRKVVLREGAAPTPYDEEGSDLLPLSRDLLDKQIIDVHGKRVVKVNDVLLEMAGGDMVLRQIEVGLAGAVRRLLSGVMSPSLVRRVSDGLSERAIPWDYVALVEPGSTRIRLKVHQQLARMHPADLADILEDLGRMERTSVVSSLDPETAAQALSEVEPSVQTSVVEAIQPDLAADLLEEMQPDEAADILGDLSEEHSRAVLNAMEEEEAGEVRELLGFKEDSAGGLMTTDFFKARADWTVGQTLDALRTVDPDLLGELDEIPVDGDDERLVGVAPLVRLVRAEGAERVTAVMRREARAVTPETKFEDVVERFEKYHLRALMVVDEFSRLVGLISIEDVFSHLVGED